MQAKRYARVLMLLENNCYPQDVRVHREATTLAAAGHRVSVISPKRSEQAWREEIDDVRVYRFPQAPEPNGFLGYLWEYGYSMSAVFFLSILVFLGRGFDVIHAHTPPDTFVFIAGLYKLLGKRFVFDHHDLSPEMYHARFGGRGNRWVHRALVVLEKLSCRLADRVIASNESHKAVEMQRGGVPEERITVVRNGPQPGFADLAGPDSGLRQKAGTIIAYVGEIGPHDGVDYLLRALHHLVHDLERTDLCTVVVGAGPTLDDVKDLAAQLKVDDHVLWTGWVSQPDVVCHVSTADICVDPAPSNPYNDRCTMIKMAEYMALGKPIVAFDLPEHRVTAHDAAVYARPNDERDFARHMARLMDDPERCREMGKIGRERVEQELAWSYQAERLLGVYGGLSRGRD